MPWLEPYKCYLFNPQHNPGGCHYESHFTDKVMTHPRSLSCETDQTGFNLKSSTFPATLPLLRAVVLTLVRKHFSSHEIAKASLQISVALLKVEEVEH